MLTLLKGGVAMCSLIGFAVPAFADGTTSPPTATAAQAVQTEGTGSDIVVTARRTEEKLRDVPVAVNAFGAKALEERRIESEVDLQIATPGLLVRETTSSNQLNYAIRGQSVDAFSYSTPAVVAYFNDVQTFNNSATAFFDLQGIQVLKGPQGTLFGRNATGGAVLYSAQKPTEDFEGYLKAGYGNYNNREIQGAINVPLADGIALRLAGSTQQRDGYQHNLLTDTWINSLDYRVARGSLLIKPTGSAFENVTVVQYGDYGGYSSGLRLQNFYPVGTPGVVTTFASIYAPGFQSPTNPAVNALFNGTGITPGAAGYLQLQNTKFGFYDVAINSNENHQAYQTFVSNTTTYALAGNAKIKNIFGYNRDYAYDQTDLDGSPYSYFSVGNGPGNNIGYTNGTKQWSDELQLSGEAADGNLKYIAGVYISQERTYVRIPFAIAPEAFANPFAGTYAFTNVDKSEALYTQLSYKLAPALNLTGGFRYTWEDVSIIQGADSLFAGFNGDQKNSKPSWLIGLDYKITPDLMIYFNQRGSWRAGGWNGTSLVNGAADPFNPETTYDFELGAKYSGRIGDVPTSLNIAIYDQYIKNVQRVVYAALGAQAGNVGEARVRGVEIDGSLRPTGWLELGGSFDYTDAVFTNNQALAGGVPYLFGPYGDSPKYSGSVYARAQTQLPDAKGQLALRGEVYTVSSFYYTNLASTIAPGTIIGGHTVANARLEWNNMLGTRLNAAAYVNNLTDKHYFAGGNALAGIQGSNAVNPGAPRMYGFDLTIKF
ncbi:TonB-dependent receptor [Novosphingobium sp. Fuku2-ISO-50]|uniref:TonB-dependent receptor n=1 Tax=Novosphingobium sp. Fuku2-ISO-50 TaxID=1739114 RepID=UPI00076D0423|nr:TonB-dependent receptor [Novosphingobium sp. Fuku2-ISO-50]KUR72066.1 hypothetical protein AQZ50_19480 [Novosphingobium sp. Fuku2-ISO-50]